MSEVRDIYASGKVSTAAMHGRLHRVQEADLRLRRKAPLRTCRMGPFLLPSESVQTDDRRGSPKGMPLTFYLVQKRDQLSGRRIIYRESCVSFLLDPALSVQGHIPEALLVCSGYRQTTVEFDYQ